MNPDYPDKLRDLGLTEQQIESILDLNAEAYFNAESFAHNERDDWEAPSLIGIESFLRTEGLIK